MRAAVVLGVATLSVVVGAIVACDDYTDGDDAKDRPPPADAGPSDVGSVDAPADRRSTLQAAPEPPPPVFPGTVGTLSVGVRTDEAATAGTDDPFEVCFAATETSPATNCQPLDIPAPINDFQVGDFNRYHFENLAIPRSQARFVVVRPRAGAGGDALRVACLDVRFDGEPVHCADGLARLIGSGSAAGESPELRQAIASSCTSCERAKLVHGPKLGPSSTDQVRVWVRTDATRKVGLYLSEYPDGESEVPVGWAYPRPEDDFAATVVSATPLDPNRTYYYRIRVDDDVKPVFRPVRTELPRQSNVRLGLGSCAKSLDQPIYTPIGDAKPDFFLFLGDNHYGNTRELGVHRRFYRDLDAIPGRMALLGVTQTIATWDDHDFVENNSDGLCAGRPNALRAFKEAWPAAGYGTAEIPGTFSQNHAGPVDLFMLDCRSYRPRVADPNRACDPDASVPPGQDLSAGPLGEPQFQWLLSGLERSDAPFKLVTCGSLVTSTTGIDSWFSFPAARQRLFDELAKRKIDGVVFASGDVHRSEFRKLERTNAYPMYELVSSPMSRDDAGKCEPPTGSKAIACYDGGNSFITVDVDGVAPVPSLKARIVDESGAVRADLTLSRSELESR